jgi:hypothetical protein
VSSTAATNRDLAFSSRDLSGSRQSQDPLAISETEDYVSLPRRRRRSHVGGLIMLTVVMVLLLAGGILAYFLFRKTEPAPLTVSSVPDPPSIHVAIPEPRRVPEANQTQINEAIRKGVDYLKKEVMTTDRLYHRSELADVAPANAHLGATALAGLTLLECGVPAEDDAVRRAAQTIRDGAGQIHATYTLATAILFLDRLHANPPLASTARANEAERAHKANRDKDRELIRSFALRLMTCQDQGGFWGYGRPVSREEEEKTLQTLREGRIPGAQLGYKNLSNSQFAALALWAARRHGVPVRPALERVARAAREKQTAEGTWSYDQNLPMKHTSACAGLIFLALERGLAEEGTVRSGAKTADIKLNRGILDDDAVVRAMAFLGKFLARPPSLSPKKREERRLTARQIKDYYEKYENTKGDKVPPVSWTMDFAFSGTIFGADSWGDLYLLWSIERVGVIYDVREIQPGNGGTDWYNWGAEIIVANQKENGQWQDRFPGVPDTCFALLFLKRANIAKDLTDKLREMMGWSAAGASPGKQTPLPVRKD